MNANWTRTLGKKRKDHNRLGLMLFGPIAIAVVVASSLYGPRPGEEAVRGPAPDMDAGGFHQPVVAEAAVEAAVEAAAAPIISDIVITRPIESGDSLSAIFDDVSIGQPVLYQILAADEALLALDVLYPGNRLTFTLDGKARGLTKMELYIHPGEQVVYRRVDEGAFEYEEVVTPGEWERQLVTGVIHGSFYQSAMDAGLSEQDAVRIAELFKIKLNFARDIRAGDRFQVVRTDQFVDGQFTGQSHIEGVRIFNRNRIHTAFLFEDGNYYDQNGESLASAFLRYPYRGHYRVTSSFSPKRKHPVTGRISPHNGTDFSMPTGTRVLSTGDGVVTRVKEHPYAGKYIEIQHSGRYVTRYLHLSRILVKKGQRVARGELIAKSGNTGRTTAPHLHFELHINSRPVNPITAKIPLLASIPEDRIEQFNEQCTSLVALMEKPATQVARLDAPAEAPL